MKVQIQSQSLRLRIDESELARLLAGEVLENQTWLGTPGALSQHLQLHDMAEALLHATRVLVMQSGRAIADETPAALLAGAGGAAAQALVAVPRAQAERLGAMAGA